MTTSIDWIIDSDEDSIAVSVFETPVDDNQCSYRVELKFPGGLTLRRELGAFYIDDRGLPTENDRLNFNEAYMKLAAIVENHLLNELCIDESGALGQWYEALGTLGELLIPSHDPERHPPHYTVQ